MNKEDFTIVLQSALFWFDGEDLTSFGYNEKLVEKGKKLADYLKSI